MSRKAHGYYDSYTCPICNKSFIKAAKHQYKVNGQYVCSNSCERKGNADKRDYRGTGERRRKPNEQTD